MWYGCMWKIREIKKQTVDFTPKNSNFDIVNGWFDVFLKKEVKLTVVVLVFVPPRRLWSINLTTSGWFDSISSKTHFLSNNAKFRSKSNSLPWILSRSTSKQSSSRRCLGVDLEKGKKNNDFKSGTLASITITDKVPMISRKSSMIFIWFLGTGAMVFQTTHNCSWIRFFIISGSGAGTSISAGSVQGKIFGNRSSLLFGNSYNTSGLFST